jgi:hypothetical protein
MPGREPQTPPPPTSTREGGADLAQIEARLRLTPEERFRLGVRASRKMIELERRLRRPGCT